MAACSRRLSIDGVRYNRVQENWRAELVAHGTEAADAYKHAFDKQMNETLRVMRSQPDRGCDFAYLLTKEAFGDANPIVALAKPGEAQ
jgi:hypothetical protein